MSAMGSSKTTEEHEAMLDIDSRGSGYRIVDLERIASLFDGLSCPKCCGGPLKLREKQRFGLDSHLEVVCDGGYIES